MSIKRLPQSVSFVCAALALVCVAAGGAAQTTVQGKASVASTSVNAPPPPKMPEVGGTTIDRVVAIVNGDLVLDSDVNEEERFEAIQPFRAPSNPNGESAYDRTVERIINRELILQQSKLQPENAVSDSDLDKEIANLRKGLPECKQLHCETDEGWTRFLAAHGFTPDEMRNRWKQRMEVLAFIEERFRMGIRITAADIKSYYEKTFVPEYQKRGGTPPKLEAVSDRIQEVLLQQQVSNLLNDWLRSLRAQGGVIVMHPGQEAP